MISVRPAHPSDLPWLLEQLREFDAFYGTGRSLFPDEEYAEQFVSTLIESGPFFIATRVGEAIAPEEPALERLGFVAGLLHPHLYNPEITQLTEAFWWVAPEHRRSRAGLLLLNAYIAYGRAHADLIFMTLEADSPVNAETLTRRGFVPKETQYLLEVP